MGIAATATAAGDVSSGVAISAASAAADFSVQEVVYQDRQSILQSPFKSLERVYTMLQNSNKAKQPTASAVCASLFFSFLFLFFFFIFLFFFFLNFWRQTQAAPAEASANSKKPTRGYDRYDQPGHAKKEGDEFGINEAGTFMKSAATAAAAAAVQPSAASSATANKANVCRML